MWNCSRPCSRGRSCDRRPVPAPKCAFSVRSKRDSRRATESCSAVWSRASGRRRPIPTPGSAGGCGLRLDSNCRSGESGLAPTTSRSSSTRPKWCSAARRRLAARQRCRRVSSSALRRWPALAGTRQWRAAIVICPGRGNWTGPSASPQRAPAPPRAARPKSLSVTEIEDWLRDPYTIYAKHVLRLRPLDPVDTEPGAAERGNIIHAAVAEFTQKYAKELPSDPVGALIALGEPRFAALEDFPEVRAFWWPRFKRIAHWFARWEAARRAGIAALSAETRGEIEIALRDGTFKLRGIADRIESYPDGRYAILDYKTGAVRTEKQVRTGLAPQLTLEAAMLRQGGFKDGVTPIPGGGSVSELAYVSLKGGARAGEFMPIDFKEGTPNAQADRALQKLAELVRRFDDDHEPYRSLVHPMWKARYGDYDHLARVKEWSSTGGPEDDIPGAP